MKKIFGCVAVLLVFSWVTTANAGLIAANVTNLSGDLKIDGFSLLPGDGDGVPSTINILFDYNNGGAVDIFQSITRGNSYNVNVDGTNTVLGPFNANFNIVSPSDFDHTGSASIDALLSRLFPTPFFVSGSPLGSLTVYGETLDLLSVTAGSSLTGYALKLATKVISGERLISNLNRLDGSLSLPADGSVTVGFTDVNLKIASVPGPNVLLLLGSGVLGMIGFSNRRITRV